MTRHLTTTNTELAHRTSDGIEVTLDWVHGGGEDRLVVTVYDSRDGELAQTVLTAASQVS